MKKKCNNGDLFYYILSCLAFMLLAMSQTSVRAQVTRPWHQTNPATVLDIEDQEEMDLTNFLAKITNADHIICTNVLNPRIFNHGYCRVTTGDNMTNLIKAIPLLKPFTTPALIHQPDLKIYFFQGTNRLAEAVIADDLLRYGDDLFEDKSGLIKSIYQPYKEFADEQDIRWQEEFFKNLGTNKNKFLEQKTNKVPN